MANRRSGCMVNDHFFRRIHDRVVYHNIRRLTRKNMKLFSQVGRFIDAISCHTYNDIQIDRGYF